MAYTEEKFFTRGTKFGKDWRISILQDGGPGAGDRITAKDKFFTKNYTFTNDRSFWNQKIIEPVLEVTIRFNPSEESFYRSIVESPDDTYRLQFQYDGSVDVFGSIRGDMVTITEQAAPKTITLRAKPLTVQRGLKYPLKGSASYVEIAPLIGDLVNQTDTDLNIYTYSDWTDPTGGGSDYFNAAALDTYHLRDYAGSKSQDQQLTYFEALERVIPEGHILTLSNGAWHLMSLPYIAKQAGNNVDRYEYTWGGTVYALNATSSVDMRKSLNSENLLLTTQSQSKHYSAYKRITQEFNHKTLISSLSFDASYLHEDIGDSPATETQEDFESNGSQRIRLSGRVTVKTDDTTGGFKTGNAQLLLQANDREYDLINNTWPTAGSEIDIGFAGTGQYLSTTFDFTTAVIPSDADGTLTVELRWASDSGGGTSWNTQEVEWSDVELQIINGSQASDNASINYTYEQTQQYAEVLGLPERIFGQGPTAYSRSAIRYFSGGNYQQLSTFSHKGDVSSVDYAELLMGDIMSAQRDGTRVIKAKLWMEYEIGDVITYDGDQYLFLGGDFNGKVSQWQGYLYKLDYNTGSDTLTEIFDISEGQQSVGIDGSSQSNNISSVSYANTNKITSITSGLSGTVTSIPINAVGNEFITVGDTFYLFDIQDASLTPFVLADAQLPNDTTLTVESKDITGNPIPSGSWVIFTGDKISSYITRSDEAIRFGLFSDWEHVESTNGEAITSTNGEELLGTDNNQVSLDQGYSSEIAVLKGQIVLKTTYDGRVAAVDINSRPEEGSEITLQADQINIEGVLNAINDNTTTTIDGGKITAQSSITVGSGSNVAVLSGVDDTYRIWAGNATAGSAPFSVQQDGTVKATKVIEVSGDGTGVVNNLDLQNLTVSGVITVDSGEIKTTDTQTISTVDYDLTTSLKDGILTFTSDDGALTDQIEIGIDASASAQIKLFEDQAGTDYEHDITPLGLSIYEVGNKANAEIQFNLPTNAGDPIGQFGNNAIQAQGVTDTGDVIAFLDGNGNTRYLKVWQ